MNHNYVPGKITPPYSYSIPPGNHGFSIGCIHEFRGQMGAGLFSMVGSVIHPQRRFQGDPRHIQLPSCTPQFGSIETHQDKYWRKPKNLQHTSRTTFRDDDVHVFLGKIAYMI